PDATESPAFIIGRLSLLNYYARHPRFRCSSATKDDGNRKTNDQRFWDEVERHKRRFHSLSLLKSLLVAPTSWFSFKSDRIASRTLDQAGDCGLAISKCPRVGMISSRTVSPAFSAAFT